MLVIGGFHHDRDRSVDHPGDPQVDRTVTQNAAVGRFDAAVDVERITGGISRNSHTVLSDIEAECRHAERRSRQRIAGHADGPGKCFGLQRIDTDAECALDIPGGIGSGIHRNIGVNGTVHGKGTCLDTVSHDLGVMDLKLADVPDVAGAVNIDGAAEII